MKAEPLRESSGTQEPAKMTGNQKEDVTFSERLQLVSSQGVGWSLVTFWWHPSTALPQVQALREPDGLIGLFCPLLKTLGLISDTKVTPACC